MSSEVPEFGGCAWPIDSACMDEVWASYSPEVQDRSVALASATLHRLTAKRVTACPITVRPCKPKVACNTIHSYPYYYAPYAPYNFAGVWTNSCGCTGSCDCTTLCEVELPRPASSVTEVKVNGDVLDETDYMLSGSILVWTGGGECPFPTTQDLSQPDTEPDTFSITYLNGYPVDSLGAYACGVLAGEFARACVGGSCRLPAGVTTIVRQGLTMEVPGGAFPNGLTGIREVDAFIALWNPRGAFQASAVWSPEPAMRRT